LGTDSKGIISFESVPESITLTPAQKAPA
jgi:hypothetical protein